MSEQLKHIPEDEGLKQSIIDVPELHIVEQGEQTAEEKELIGRISQIRGLHHERTAIVDLFSFSDELKSSVTQGDDTLRERELDELKLFLLRNPNNLEKTSFETINEDGVKAIIDDLIEGNNQHRHAEYISQVGNWLETLDNKKRDEVIVQIEKQVASALKGRGDLGLSIAAFLGEVAQHKVVKFVEEELVDELETGSTLSWQLRDQLVVLNRLNDESGNVLLHKIVDFFQEHVETMQNYTPDQEAKRPWQRGLKSTFDNFHSFVRGEMGHSKNYLIKKHLQDYFETIHTHFEGKPGTVTSIAGGSSDKTIYTFQNLDRSYNNRLALGINEGWPIANPVLPIAPDYYGYYQNGKLVKIFHSPELDYKKAKKMEAEYIAKNHPDDEYIYDEINRPDTYEEEQNPPLKTDKLHDIKNFVRHLKRENREFFYDLDRIEDPEELHPIVYGDLLSQNQNYIKFHQGNQNTIEPIKEAEYGTLLFPNGDVDQEKEYTYRFLMSLSMRKKIEDDFSVNLAELPFSSQVQFLDFLVNKDVGDFEKITGTIASYKGDKLAVMKSFFACAENENFAGIILGLADELKDNPELGNTLFGAYANFVEALNKNVAAIQDVQRSVFTDVNLDETQVFQTLSARTNELLAHAAASIEGKDSEEKKLIVDTLISNFKQDEATLVRQFDEFEKAAQVVKLRMAQFNETIKQIPLARSYGYILNPIATEDEELYEAISNKDLPDFLKEDLRQRVRSRPKHITSERIQMVIDDLQKQIEELPKNMEYLFADESDEVMGKPVIGKAKEDFETETRPSFLRIIKDLRELLKFQKAFERKFQSLITREAENKLPAELLARLPQEVAELQAEPLPRQEPLYFPVGISKEMPEWQAVLAGKKEAAKPIDAYGYLFWLNNQGKPARLVVCDEIQTVNYQSLYNVTETEARQTARAIGERERATYQAIIDTFGLSNIEVVDYQSFQAEHAAAAERYQPLCVRLAEHPVFQEAFMGMAQESVAGSSAEEKKKHLEYGMEELVSILAANGTKVSHRNEARYDILAAFILTAEQLARENGLDLAQLMENSGPEGEFRSIIDGATLKMQDTLNAYKNRLDKAGEAAGYIENMSQGIKMIEKKLKLWRGPNRVLPDVFPKSSKASFNFVCPNTSSQSFGWRSRGAAGDETVMKFREPYSTYFYQDGGEVFLNSDQVVAAPAGLIAGKVLALDSETQAKYAAAVVKPLLLQFFKSLEVAPHRYFETIGKNYQELLADCRGSKTILDLLQFVQKYVVAPSVKQTAAAETARPASPAAAGQDFSGPVPSRV